MKTTKVKIKVIYVSIIIIILILCSSCIEKYIRYSNLPVPYPKYQAAQYRDLNEEEKRRFLKEEKKYSNDIIDAIINEKVKRGMTKEQAIYSWGRPDDINSSTGSWGTHDQWVYRRGELSTQYLYFENGILTSWQNH